MSKAKKSNTIPESAIGAKNVSVDMYYNTIAHQLAPSTKEHKKRVAIAFVEWARTDSRAYSPLKFILDQGITWVTWDRWRKADPILQEMHEAAMQYMASRRETGALEKSLDANFVKWNQALYDPRIKEMEEWRSKLGETSENGGTKIVIMEKFKEE